MILRCSWNGAWHPWFAWYPVDIGGGRCAWLETVERQWTQDVYSLGDFSGYSYGAPGYRYRQHVNEETITDTATEPGLSARDTGADAAGHTESDMAEGS
jgi:hypothetical protein